MHVREHVELAALLASRGPAELRKGIVLRAEGLERFWTASKCRLDRWGVRLKSHSQLVQSSPASELPRCWNAVEPVLQEILVGDALTRVWMSLVMLHDQIQGSMIAQPIARSVYLGHMESRNRALGFVLNGRGLPAEKMVALNRLRRQTERWTDMLLGYIAADSDIDQFGHDRARIRDFAMDIRDERRHLGTTREWHILLNSAQDAFRHDLIEQPANADLNRKIATAVMACLGRGFFDTAGLIKSLWEARLAHAMEDTQTLVDQLLES